MGGRGRDAVCLLDFAIVVVADGIITSIRVRIGISIFSCNSCAARLTPTKMFFSTLKK
jgi:hypothetical protein